VLITSAAASIVCITTKWIFSTRCVITSFIMTSHRHVCDVQPAAITDYAVSGRSMKLNETIFKASFSRCRTSVSICIIMSQSLLLLFAADNNLAPL
jgi:hypothetical protein